MNNYEIKKYIYNGVIEYLDNECIRAILDVMKYLNNHYDIDDDDDDYYTINNFLPSGNIRNVIITILDEKGKCILYLSASINNKSHKKYLIDCIYGTWNILQNEIDYLKEMITMVEELLIDTHEPEDSNIYYISWGDEMQDYMDDILKEIGYRQIKNYSYGYLNVKALNGNLIDNEMRHVSTFSVDEIFRWLLNNQVPLYEYMSDVEILGCIESIRYLEHIKVLNNICDNERLYEMVYCLISKKIYKLDRIETLDEIIYHNHIIHCYMTQLKHNEIVLQYKLDDMYNHEYRKVFFIEEKYYQKKELISKITSILDLVKKLRREHKIVCIKKLYSILSHNLYLLESNQNFLDTTIKKLKEFKTSEKDTIVNDILAENWWFHLIKN